ncbi:hypothetical protein [uncultured Marivita sp.]|uniref:hypothetical protein n=1 Tax=uncultured Marivita sp. TaxID=888080 RepID=UPI00260579C2|nr:hypothetical protein [uncultured Marivita sp.]
MNINKTFTGLLLGAGLFLSACAEQAQRVPATYIPSIVYRGANCQELYNERVTLAGYVRHVTAEQRKAAQSDTVFFTTSALIFWPAIFALPISVDQSAQLASARGHYDAISKAMVEQGCVVGAGPARHAPAVTPKSAPAPVHVQRYPSPQPIWPDWKRYPGQFPPM